MGWRYRERQKIRETQRRRSPRISIPFKRLEAVLFRFESGDNLNVRVFLNDLSETGVGFFATERLTPGEQISLEFLEPANARLNGHVMWSNEILHPAKIISKYVFTHRAGVQFSIENDADREELNKLITWLDQLPRQS